MTHDEFAEHCTRIAKIVANELTKAKFNNGEIVVFTEWLYSSFKGFIEQSVVQCAEQSIIDDAVKKIIEG